MMQAPGPQEEQSFHAKDGGGIQRDRRLVVVQIKRVFLGWVRALSAVLNFYLARNHVLFPNCAAVYTADCVGVGVRTQAEGRPRSTPAFLMRIVSGWNVTRGSFWLVPLSTSKSEPV